MSPPFRMFSFATFVVLTTIARSGGSQPVDAGTSRSERAQHSLVPLAEPPVASSTAQAQPSPSRSIQPIDAARIREPLDKLVADVRGFGGRISVLAADA